MRRFAERTRVAKCGRRERFASNISILEANKRTGPRRYSGAAYHASLCVHFRDFIPCFIFHITQRPELKVLEWDGTTIRSTKFRQYVLVIIKFIKAINSILK